MAGIVYDEEVIWTGAFQERRHLDAELDARVGHRRYIPSLGVVAVLVAQHLGQGREVGLDGRVVFPSQEKGRGTRVGRPLALEVYVYGGILQMAGEGLEVVPFGGWRLLGSRVLLLLWRLCLPSLCQSSRPAAVKRAGLG